MKRRLLAMLLTLCLIITLLPVNAFAATETVTETISFADDTQRVSQDASAQVWKNGVVTFTNNKASSSNNVANFTNPVRAYAGSSIMIEAPGIITEIVFSCESSNYATVIQTSSSTGTVTISGKSATVSLFQSTNSYTITKLTGQSRIYSVAVTYIDCAHTDVKESVVDPTCETDGSITTVCEACGLTTTTKTDDALGHNYVNGKCSRCNADKPVGYVKASLADIKATDVVIITMTKEDKVYALSNNNGTSAAPTAVLVEPENNVIPQDTVPETILWNIVQENTDLIFYVKDTTEKWLYCTNINNGVRVGTNDNKTFTIDAASGYLKHAGTARYVGVYTSKPDWRCYTSVNDSIPGQTLIFYVLQTSSSGPGEQECQHTGGTATCTTQAVCDLCKQSYGEINPDAHSWSTGKITTLATCTEAGETTYTCINDATHIRTEAIPALGHNYANGLCTHAGCGAIDPLPGKYYIATIRSSGNYWYMTSDLGTASTKRYQAVDTGLTELPASITNPADQYVFEIVAGDGTYKIKASGIDETNNYLGWTSGNSGTLVAAENAVSVTPIYNEDGTVQLHFTATEDERYLSLNNSSGNNYFAWYAGTQKQNLSLIPVKECQHNYQSEITKAATCTTEGEITYTCTACGNNYTESVTVDPNNHASSEFTYVVNETDSTKHDKKYACCGVVVATEDHTTEQENNAATCQKQAVCDLCGTEYGAKNADNHTSTLGTPVPTGDGKQHTATYDCCGTEVTENHSFDENGKCVCGAVEVIISVSISWGTLEFTYDDTLDGTTGEEKGWTDNGTGWVKVENTGETAVTVTYIYDTQRTDIAGFFSDGTDRITGPVTIDPQATKQIWLILENKPAEVLHNTHLGTVKLTIE